MLRSLPIAWRITVLVLLGASLVLGAVSAYSYWSARDFLEQQKRAEIRATAQATANRIESVGRSVEKVVQGLAFSVDDTEPGLRRARVLLRHTVSSNEELFGSGLGYEPSVYGRVAPYVYQPSSAYGSPEEQDATSSGKLVEMIELEDHPWFLAVQFHPEFKSKPDRAHPLFREFVRHALAFQEEHGLKIPAQVKQEIAQVEGPAQENGEVHA